MDITIYPSSVSGIVRTPSSKSIAIRAIVCAMLTNGKSHVYYPSLCDDAVAMISVARQMGAEVTIEPNSMVIDGNINPRINKFNCGESGLTARLIIALASLFNEEVTISGEGTIMNRNLGNICEALGQMGVTCQSKNGYLPFIVHGSLQGGEINVDGSGGSQFISGLLMALPLVKQNSKLVVRNLKSIPYINMTIDVLGKFGIEIQHHQHQIFHIEGNQEYHPTQIEIEGDWSGAAFLLVASAVAGSCEITGLNLQSKQADQQILSVFKMAGVNFMTQESGVLVHKSKIKSFTFDATHCPDLFPPLAVLAAVAHGISKISGVSRLIQKESNRGVVIQQELGKLGIKITLDSDQMIIEGGKIWGGTISSNNDHRIAMAGAVAALIAIDPVIIKNAECVSKSYPEFYYHLKMMGAIIK